MLPSVPAWGAYEQAVMRGHSPKTTEQLYRQYESATRAEGRTGPQGRYGGAATRAAIKHLDRVRAATGQLKRVAAAPVSVGPSPALANTDPQSLALAARDTLVALKNAIAMAQAPKTVQQLWTEYARRMQLAGLTPVPLVVLYAQARGLRAARVAVTTGQSGLNLREGASPSTRLLAQLPNGTGVIVLREELWETGCASCEWWEVETSNGVRGFLRAIGPAGEANVERL